MLYNKYYIKYLISLLNMSLSIIRGIRCHLIEHKLFQVLSKYLMCSLNMISLLTMSLSTIIRGIRCQLIEHKLFQVLCKYLICLLNMKQYIITGIRYHLIEHHITYYRRNRLVYILICYRNLSVVLYSGL